MISTGVEEGYWGRRNLDIAWDLFFKQQHPREQTEFGLGVFLPPAFQGQTAWDWCSKVFLVTTPSKVAHVLGKGTFGRKNNDTKLHPQKNSTLAQYR